MIEDSQYTFKINFLGATILDLISYDDCIVLHGLFVHGVNVKADAFEMADYFCR